MNTNNLIKEMPFSENGNIIQSMLDTDFYKLTMMQAVLHNYPNTDVEWSFKCRNKEDLTPYLPEIRRQIDSLADIALTEDQARYLEKIPYIKPDFVRFLTLFRFNPRYVNIKIEKGELEIKIRGPWLQVILFEIPILAIVSEIRNRFVYGDVQLEQATEQLYKKLDFLDSYATPEELKSFHLADFGTRRRFSYKVQENIVEILKKDFKGVFVGTSNVHLASEKNIAPIGTMAHEWLMPHQQIGCRLIDSQKAALETWVQEYRGELGIALTDVITTDAFLKDFDLYFAKLFDGLRHDSGDPIVFAEKCIKHYESLKIDPKTKTLVFSDGLNFKKAIDIQRAIGGRIKTSFGIGTSLTCDIPGVEPMNIVIKMTSCNGQPVAKISDSQGKTMCEDEEFVSYLKHVFKVE